MSRLTKKYAYREDRLSVQKIQQVYMSMVGAQTVYLTGVILSCLGLAITTSIITCPASEARHHMPYTLIHRSITPAFGPRSALEREVVPARDFHPRSHDITFGNSCIQL